MCTVTFLPFGDRIYITSNRDEQTARPPADLPEAAVFSTGKILFPRDQKAGGTWIALHNNGNVMVLLNGAFIKHLHKPPYRKSRGLIFLDIFDSELPTEAFREIDLRGIEPFTLVIWQHGELWEARWDGTDRFLTPKPSDVPRMWCSVTLYDPEVIARRRAWFDAFLSEQKYVTGEQVRAFHEFAGDGDEANSLKMNRSGIVQTVSITGVEIRRNRSVMHYKDFSAGLVSVNEWFISNDLIHS